MFVDWAINRYGVHMTELLRNSHRCSLQGSSLKKAQARSPYPSECRGQPGMTPDHKQALCCLAPHGSLVGMIQSLLAFPLHFRWEEEEEITVQIKAMLVSRNGRHNRLGFIPKRQWISTEKRTHFSHPTGSVDLLCSCDCLGARPGAVAPVSRCQWESFGPGLGSRLGEGLNATV